MLCLLDKVTARAMLRGLLKFGHAEALNAVEQASIQLFFHGISGHIELCISPPTAHILEQFAEEPLYAQLIHSFLQEVSILSPTRYFKRWSRRLREQGFSREDAAILALATFATLDGAFTSVDYVATFDQRMINNWHNQQTVIHARFYVMHNNLAAPYTGAKLPQVVHPTQIEL